MIHSPTRTLALVVLAVGGVLLLGSGGYYLYRWLRPPDHSALTGTSGSRRSARM